MKNKIIIALVSAVLMSVMLAGPAFADGNETSEYWYQDGSNWKINDGSGTMIKDSWVCDDKYNGNRDSNWYLMNPYGVMYEGIINDNGHYYLLDPTHEGTYGMMISGTSTYTFNDVTLTLETEHNGYFGEILNPEAISGLGLGVTNVNTSGKPFLYTSQFSGTKAAAAVPAATNASERLNLVQGTWAVDYVITAGEFSLYPASLDATVNGNTLTLTNGKTYTLTDDTENDKRDKTVFLATFSLGGKDKLSYAFLHDAPTLYLDLYYENKEFVFNKK